MQQYQTRRRKKRGFPLICLSAGILFCVLFFKFFFNNHSEQKEVQQASVIPDLNLYKEKSRELLHHVLEQEPKPLIHIVRPGDSFYGIFRNSQLNENDIARIIESFGILKLTTLYPGDSILIYKKSNDSFSSVTFFNKFHQKYSVNNNDSCIRAEKTDLPTTIYTYVLTGSLETSLSESMFNLGVSDIITATIADIFAWDINFFIDPRKGDTFQVIFERKVINGQLSGYGNILAARYSLGNQKTYHAIGIKDKENKMHYYDTDGNALQKQFLKAPLRFSRISSGFSYRRKHPILGIVRPHLGVDYAAPYGTPVHAAADGKISFIGKKGGYGNLIIVSHGGAYQTYYGHLQSFARKMHSGKYISQGDCIGRVGATGLATGPHLDYRMKKGSTFVNPLKISSPPLKSISDDKRDAFFATVENYRFILEQRFLSQHGCHLIEIVQPEPVFPEMHIIAKPVTKIQKIENEEIEG